MAAAKVSQHIPNILTASRLVLAPPIFLAALSGQWALGFWLLLVALATDFADGLAAKALHAQSALGEQLDPIADFTLAAAGVGGIIASGHLDWWVGIVMLIPALYVGYIKFFSKDDKIRLLQPMFSVPYLFTTWTGMTWAYAALAYGWSWWYVTVSIAILCVAAVAKRHRLKVWFGWLLARFGRSV